MDMRDQVQHLQGQLDQVRGESSDREVEAAELRERLAAAQAQVESIRGRTAQAADDVATLKVKVTERDREVERLRREMDTREYDLKALREENERLAEYCQVDSGKQNQLERKVRNLEAVIDDNRSLIAELRRSLEEKDREVREVRLGAGIADLEQEKQRLLDDYHKKSRELDAARSTIASHAADLAGGAAEREALEARVRQLEEAARTRRSEREDISDHPEYKARVREIQARDESLAQVRVELDRALKQQAECPPEERTRLAAELAAAQEKAKVLAARVEELQGRLAAKADEPAPIALPAAATPDVRAFLDGTADAIESLLDGLTVLSSGLRDTIGFLTALAKSDLPLPAEAAERLDGATLLETAESLRDTLRLITSEADAIRSRWAEGEPLWKRDG
jgi:chromosome segregation ATPase